MEKQKGRFKYVKEMNGLGYLKEGCEMIRRDMADVTTPDWQAYLQAGSDRCFEQRCARPGLTVRVT